MASVQISRIASVARGVGPAGVGSAPSAVFAAVVPSSSLVSPMERSWGSKREKSTLVMMRHGQSEWNLQNRFTGWVDVHLTDQGRAEATAAGVKLKEAGFEFDIAFTSVLRRAINTLHLALDNADQLWLPVVRDYRFNERHYGGLAGLDKAETAEKHGADQVKIWRRSYDIPPPSIDADHEFSCQGDRRYDGIHVPPGESLKMTLERVLPAYDDLLVPQLSQGKTVLLAAHGNSLRALVKHLDGISNDDILEINIPTGVPLVYELDDDLSVIPAASPAEGLGGYYLE